MTHMGRIIGIAVAGIMLLGMTSVAQDPEPPFTWKGKGVASFISKEGPNDVHFDIQIRIDADGTVSGKTSTDDGSADIERLYYGEKVKFELPELTARRLVLVLMINKDSDNPSVVIMNGRTLVDKFCYGELLIRRISADLK
ncbi:MAG: hypothetical protein ABIH23_18050, partial [bacterium]